MNITSLLARPDERLMRGPLFSSGGIAVVAGLPDAATCAALAAEAQQEYSRATRQECSEAETVEGRGGVPRRSLASAGGGAVQDRFYASSQLAGYLSNVCGTRMVPSGNRGSYSYYTCPGDFLDLHLDIDTCDLTVITVLADTCPPPGGSLAVRRQSIGLPLSLAAADDEELVKAPAGSSIVILGGLVPHRVPPLPSTGQRVISALCFRAVGG